MTVNSYRLSGNKIAWYYVIDLPPGQDGKRRQQKRRGFPSQKAAAAAEKAALQSFGHAGLAADGSVAAELQGWLDERELDVEETTLCNYRDLIRCYVNPHIGSRQLYALDKRVLHELYKTLLRSGNKSGGPLSATTVRNVHRVLMKALKDLGISIEGVRQPKKVQRQTMGRKGVWTAPQASAFLKFHATHRLHAAWVLAVVLGMRRGELAGLKWTRLDLARGVLFVDWQRTTTSAGVVEKSPKGRSTRPIAIGGLVVAVLEAHHEAQAAEKAAAGIAYQDLGYVFCREDGKPYYPKYFTDKWELACRAAGLPVIALHDARHTSATAGADGGVPEHVMQHRLGHAEGRTTRMVYTHVLPDAERRAAELMERALLSGPRLN
ncbi:site-specific integrase [Micromonospora sp. AMSO12t]|uniref:tyrosine-type recombinase/integrase n=1 Tax=Micromonospora sp. AMSO12t TaxID=2650410 RepID=UPI00124B42F9|nr:site-specific integrase [Micromonospora sp. AMSO12t]KAB1160106.1 site-specific integrase [Micromonospora sp. AMSO12t]